MVLPVIFFAAAGALAGGGLGGGWYFWQRGVQESARIQGDRDADNIRRALVAQTDLASVKRDARAAGVDVEAAIAGYEALKAGQLTPGELANLVLSGRAAIPSDRPDVTQSQLGSGVSKATTAEIRAWARDNGYPVASRGPIPRHILDAYHSSHG